VRESSGVEAGVARERCGWGGGEGTRGSGAEERDSPLLQPLTAEDQREREGKHTRQGQVVAAGASAPSTGDGSGGGGGGGGGGGDVGVAGSADLSLADTESHRGTGDNQSLHTRPTRRLSAGGAAEAGGGAWGREEGGVRDRDSTLEPWTRESREQGGGSEQGSTASPRLPVEFGRTTTSVGSTHSSLSGRQPGSFRGTSTVARRARAHAQTAPFSLSFAQVRQRLLDTCTHAHTYTHIHAPTQTKPLSLSSSHERLASRPQAEHSLGEDAIREQRAAVCAAPPPQKTDNKAHPQCPSTRSFRLSSACPHPLSLSSSDQSSLHPPLTPSHT